MSVHRKATDDSAGGIDVREQGNTLRVATNTPHLVSLGTGRLSTAVTLHPIKQGSVTIGSDPTSDIYVAGTGVCPLHCRIGNAQGAVTLYPLAGSTLLDGASVTRPTPLRQGSMLTIGRSNYLRFNHPEEAKMMKSAMPGGHISMAPVQFSPNDECELPPSPGFAANNDEVTEAQYYQQTDAFKQKMFKDAALNALDKELDMTLKEMNKKKPPVAPRKPYKESDLTDSNSDQDSLNSFGNAATPPKTSNIMAKVSKFEYYAKQQKIGRSQFFTNENVDYSPKVFSSNSLTVNTPAKDVLIGKNMPTNYKNVDRKMVVLSDNNSIDPRNCSYANVMIKNKISKIDDIVRNFDAPFEGVTLKKVNNVDNEKQANETKTDNTHRPYDLSIQNSNISKVSEKFKEIEEQFKSDTRQVENENEFKTKSCQEESTYGRINVKKETKLCQPSPSFDRNPQFSPNFTTSSHVERNEQAENLRKEAHRHRVEEQRQREAESARLEEILSMCAEYERQISAGTPLTPTEKRSQNKIITNGSLPRSGLNSPNFIQTSDGYYKFDTSQNRMPNSVNKSLPIQRNLSNYENVNISVSPLSSPPTPQITIRNPSSYENVGRMDEIGIPVTHELSSPVMIRKIQDSDLPKIPNESPIASPYENVFYGKPGIFKPKSPNTNSPRTRIKTSFAHKNVSPPQYFVFPTPPPIEDNSKVFPNFDKVHNSKDEVTPQSSSDKHQEINKISEQDTKSPSISSNLSKISNISGIEKQLSLDEEIPMIDDADLMNDLEIRSSQVSPDIKSEKDSPDNVRHVNDETKIKEKVIDCDVGDDKLDFMNSQLNNLEVSNVNSVKRELIADIPELEEFERDIRENRKNKIDNELEGEVRIFVEEERPESQNFDDFEDLKAKYDNLRDSRKKVVTEIRELKAKMSEIRTQEDDILRELEMEKALIKGEYDSEIAILNIEHSKKRELTERAREVEEEMRVAKSRQEERQAEFRSRLEAAEAHVQRLEEALAGGVSSGDDLQSARDLLDNETKLFEDLEFQHLEAESEMLAYREDLQNEIMTLTKRIDSQKTRILTLKSEANNNLTSALEETKVLQADYRKLLNKVEELTSIAQKYEKELKEIAPKLNLERAQSPLSSYSAENAHEEKLDNSTSSSESDDINFEAHQKNLNDKFNSIDQMSQSMMVDLGEKRHITDLIDQVTMVGEPEIMNVSNVSEDIQTKEKKGFWERNFDSLSRFKGKKKSPTKTDIMSQSLNENLMFNNDNIESEYGEIQKFGSLKSKKKQKQNGVQTPLKSSSSSKIPTFSALGKIMKKDSFKKMNKEETTNKENIIETKSNPVKPVRKNLKSRTTPDIEEDFNETETERSSYADSLEGTIEDLPDNAKHTDSKKPFNEHNNKILLRKSCGDEPGIMSLPNELTVSFSEYNKVPSQDDIDRISKVRLNSPLVSKETDMNSLGRKTLDSLMEIERNRVTLLEEQGCQVIEHEREKISELKRRVQDEAKRQWESERVTKRKTEAEASVETSVGNDVSRTSVANDGGVSHSREQSFEGLDDRASESLRVSSPSIEQLNSPKSVVRRRGGGRPDSDTSDVSGDNTRSSLRVTPYFARTDLQRPLTRYLPIDREDFDLRQHIEAAGHQVERCPHVVIDGTSCRGYLHKLGAKFHAWSKRWFVFDRVSKTFIYYSDKSERKPRGGAYFQVIEEVYLDHGNASRSPSPQTTFVVKTRKRRYYLMSPSGEAARIWIDVIFTGAQGYTEYMQ